MGDYSKSRRMPGTAISTRLEKVADALEIPREFLAGTMKLTVVGDNELTLEGRLSVIEYTENLLSVSAMGYILTIDGEGFEVTELDTDFLKLTGKIRTIGYIS